MPPPSRKSLSHLLMGIEELDLAIEDARARVTCAAERYAELAALTRGTIAQAESTLNRAHACLSKISKQRFVVDRRLRRGAARGFA